MLCAAQGKNQTMTPSELLDLILRPAAPSTEGDLRAFLDTPLVIPAPSWSAFESLAERACRAGGRLRAGAAGHQAAIRRLFPATPAGAVTAFCVSEDQGPRPSAIRAALTPDGDGWVLNGTKRWGSMSPLADILYICASLGERDGRNQLRMVRVPATASGIEIDVTPYARYVGHMPIADIRLTNVPVAADNVLEADAYEAFIKPFRLVEDVYSVAALQIAVFRLGRRAGWPGETLEDLLALILQAHAIAQTSMDRPGDVLVMSSYFRASIKLWDGLGDYWRQASDADRTAFSPDVGLLGVAARAREARRQKAWADLAAT
jgi:hypothetical protein